MGSIGRYTFRTTLISFLVVLLSLTAIIWVTQALRDLDIVTRQGQSILAFVGITGLIIPLLVMIIAPLALFIAVAHTLNKLSSDSEIIVMNAAGMSPWRFFRAFIPITLLVTALVLAISTYFAPKGLRMLRDQITEVRYNVVSNIVQPARFVTIVNGVTMHIRARRSNGQLVGVFIDDRRDPSERSTIIAESGDLLQNDSGTFLVLHNGTVQRQEASQPDPSIVGFMRYAIDLSRFSSGPISVVYSIRERFLWQLAFPDPKDQWLKEQPGEFRAEFYDRIVAPFYPIAFVIIAFAYLGTPRTTRQARTSSMLGAIGGMLLLRMIGFVSSVLGAKMPVFLYFNCFAVLATIGIGLRMIYLGATLELPAFLTNAIASINDRFSRRFAAG
jgi:lipopolysaccharide export system permease protein